MKQLELFHQRVRERKAEYIKEKDYVYIKRNNTNSNIFPMNLYKQGYVTKIENIENKRLCHVFFGRRKEKYYDYQLTKREPYQNAKKGITNESSYKL